MSAVKGVVVMEIRRGSSARADHDPATHTHPKIQGVKLALGQPRNELVAARDYDQTHPTIAKPAVG